MFLESGRAIGCTIQRTRTPCRLRVRWPDIVNWRPSEFRASRTFCASSYPPVRCGLRRPRTRSLPEFFVRACGVYLASFTGKITLGSWPSTISLPGNDSQRLAPGSCAFQGGCIHGLPTCGSRSLPRLDCVRAGPAQPGIERVAVEDDPLARIPQVALPAE